MISSTGSGLPFKSRLSIARKTRNDWLLPAAAFDQSAWASSRSPALTSRARQPSLPFVARGQLFVQLLIASGVFAGRRLPRRAWKAGASSRVSRVSVASSFSSSARALPMSPEDAWACARHIATSRPRGFFARAAIVALLMLQACEEAVELAALEVKLGQLADHVELVIEFFRRGRTLASTSRSLLRFDTARPASRPACSTIPLSAGLARTALRRASSPSSGRPSPKQSPAKNS